MSLTFCRRFIALAVALLFFASPTLAFEHDSPTLVLRSPEQHGGATRWQMKKRDEVTGGGEQISRPGFALSGWMPAVVPGTVLNSLVYDKVYPEPYFGVNNAYTQKLIPDIADAGRAFYTYWFRTEFSVPASFRNRRVLMQCDGVNYRAQFWVNGVQVGNLAGMFQRGFLDITDALRPAGPNGLAILVEPIDEPGGLRGRPGQPLALGENSNGGDGVIGRNVTMLMSAGWDFTARDGIRDRNTGIWRDIKIYSTGPVMLRYPFVKSKLPLPALSSARETISVQARNLTGVEQKGMVQVAVPGTPIRLAQAVTLAPHEERDVTFVPEAFPALVMNAPRLWWPFNKGEQFLYPLTAQFVASDGRVSDRLSTRFGVREVSSDQNTPDKSRMFYVNGKRFFVRGSNWIPEAMCRMSDDRTDAELRYTRQSGVNFLRLWGGGIAESDRFYEDCDALGILVWMEFWQTGNTDKPKDADLYRANVRETVERLRNHPSLAYYVSANESNRIVPIEDILQELDGTRGYQTQSETAGVHDGSPYAYVNPMFYYDDTASDRGSRINGFCPEYGTPCVPTVDALREMMAPEDLWPINKTVWDYLDGGGFHSITNRYAAAVDQYGASKNIEEWDWKAQMVGAVGYRGIWESWNRNRFEYGERFASGVLFWYHNSPLRQTAGRMWDWSLEPTAALYATQNALQPLHAQFDFIKNTVSVNNEFLRSFPGYTVRMRVWNSDMTLKLQQDAKVNLPADGVANDVMKVMLPDGLSPVHFIRLDLLDARGQPVSQTFYWRSTDAYQGPKTLSGPLYAGFEAINDLPPAQLKAIAALKPSQSGGRWMVTLQNTGKTLAFFVQVKLVDRTSGKPLRPSFYSDNFISLLPGEARVISIEGLRPNPVFRQASVVIVGWNVAARRLVG